MLKKLRVKFICCIMAIVTVMLSTIVVTVVYFTGVNLKADSLRIMESIASDPMQLGVSTMQDGTRLPYFALQIGRRREVLAIGGAYDMSNEQLLQELIQKTFYAEKQYGELEENNLRYYRKSDWNKVVIVFQDLTSERATIYRLKWVCAIIAIISFGLFFLISLLLARWMVKPVDEAWKQQQQFVSDASHELKTPLTVILTNAELLQQDNYDSEAKGNFSNNILAVARQMRSLVENLLDLARVDNGVVRSACAVFNFSDALEEVILPYEPVYFEKGLELESRIEPSIMVNGSEMHLRHVAEILLDNAQKYSLVPARVTLGLQRHGKNQCIMYVANPGPPIAPEDLKNIFKRFYRADSARPHDGSYGLGLPIAEGIVREHGGRIWASSCGGINTFYVSLPVA